MEPIMATVSQLNAYMKRVVDGQAALNDIWIKGEISNFKDHYSGHLYITLKDDGGVLKAVLFKGAAANLTFKPEDGMKVIARGRIGVYEQSGTYQLYISEMTPDGLGELYVAYEQLKKKLGEEGLFDDSNKKPIPKYPEKVGVITAATGAAVRDIINVITRRYPYCEIIIYPAQVQGQGAAESVVKGIEYFNETGLCDTLIVGRGGGSIEDLWAFNEEIVARQIFSMKTPVISAVRHETDFTIADFVADRRVPTPSAAAEIAVPSGQELGKFLKIVDGRLYSALVGKLESSQKELKLLLEKEVLKNPLAVYDVKRMQIDSYSMQMENTYRKLIHSQRERFVRNVAKLDALSPLKILERGYSVASDSEGNPASSVSAFRVGDSVTVTMSDGALNCNIIEIEEKQ